MARIPVEWILSVNGANEVKSVMNDLNSAFDRGQINADEYTNSMAKLARESNRYNSIGRYQNQIFMAMHPSINKLSRSLSTFASISRTALSFTTALNTGLLRLGQSSSGAREIEAEISKLRRSLAWTPEDEKQSVIEEISALEAKLKELKDQEVIGAISDVITAIAGIGITISSLFPLISKLGTRLGVLKGVGTGIGASSAVGGLGAGAAAGAGFATGSAMAGGLTGVGIGAAVFPSIDEWLKANNEGYMKWAEFRDNVMKPGMDKFFLEDIPAAIGGAGQFLTNFFLNDLPNWARQGWQTVSDVFVTTWNSLMGFIEDGINGALQGFASFVNKIIDGINKIISGINRAFNSNIPTIGAFVIDKVSLPRIETGNTGVKSSPAIGTGITNNITIMGSILAERELMTVVNKNTKQTYKSSGLSVN